MFKAYAKDLADIYQPAQKLGGSNATIATLINPLIFNILILSGLAAFIISLIAGFSRVTAGGDKAKIEQATRMLNYSLLGLVVVAAAFLLTRLVGSLVGLDPFSPN